MPPTIVVLDAGTFNKGDLDLAPLEALGRVAAYDCTAADQLAARAAEADAVLFINLALTAAVLEQLPRLRYIGILATGTNAVDLPAARRRGITVTNVPGYGTDSVAQHTWALILALACGLVPHDQAVHDGTWTRWGHSRLTVAPITELAGRTLAVVGLGTIGRQVARIGAAFGMRVAAARHGDLCPPSVAGVPVAWMDLDDLFAAADVLTLHCPLNPRTQAMVNAARLATMKPDALLINTARGALVDEAALAAALEQGRLGGAGLDVLCVEPPATTDHPLLRAPRCLITPHVAWASRQARQRLFDAGVANLAAYLAGRPTNVVA